MVIPKSKIINNICYTELVYGRINKKLGTKLSDQQIEKFILQLLEKTPEKFYLKEGKNFYVTNVDYNIRLTINSTTFRIITVDNI